MVCRLGSGWHLWFASLGIGKSKCCPAPNKLKSSPFAGHTFAGHTFAARAVAQPDTWSDACACCSDAHQAHDCMDLTNCVTQ